MKFELERTRLEFYCDKECVGAIQSHGLPVPRKGELVSIKKETFKVTRVTWALDYSDKHLEKVLRANIEMEIAE